MTYPIKEYLVGKFSIETALASWSTGKSISKSWQTRDIMPATWLYWEYLRRNLAGQEIYAGDLDEQRFYASSWQAKASMQVSCPVRESLPSKLSEQGFYDDMQADTRAYAIEFDDLRFLRAG